VNDPVALLAKQDALIYFVQLRRGDCSPYKVVIVRVFLARVNVVQFKHPVERLVSVDHFLDRLAAVSAAVALVSVKLPAICHEIVPLMLIICRPGAIALAGAL
jgi:hypothetical protein